MAIDRKELQRIQALLQDLEPKVRDAFLVAILNARRAVDLSALEDALRTGNVRRAAELLTMNQSLLFPLDAALVGGLNAGGMMVAEAAGRAGVILGFDGRHPRAEQWARSHVGGLIREIIEDQREMARGTVEAMLAEGRAPRSAALDMTGRMNRLTGRREGGYIGLTDAQAGYARNARAELENLSRAYFDRALRDRRFDRLVDRAIREGRPLSVADIDRITGRYRDRLLAHRGETIAQTESINALRAGRREGYQQAIDSGRISDSRVTRRWSATMDGRTRRDHQEMNDKTVQGMNATWTLPDGSQMRFPGDTSLGASAKQVVRCRCYEEFNVDWLSGPMG
ncbi:phage head morphogenesis protein [Cereibacter sphaeroides]|nr:phage head morphogenesis protein [Cereibacter sphaeroides]